MKRTFSALVISGALLCTLAVPGMAAEAEGQPGDSAAASAPQAQTLPASVLYFGQVTQVIRDEAVQSPAWSSPLSATVSIIMNISSDTVWIRQREPHCIRSRGPEGGESVYVFHSPFPPLPSPQSAAYAVVRNIPQDISCAQYHVVEEITEGGGRRPDRHDRQRRTADLSGR